MIFPRPTQFCWVCGKAVAPAARTTDEHGYFVHEQCYAAKQALAMESIRLSKAQHKTMPGHNSEAH